MVTVFVSHPPDKLDTYFGAKATEALAAIATIRFNDAPGDGSLPDLIAAARGCDALIAYRQTAAPEALFRALPELFAFIRCAVDIRTVDVAAASAHGVLVTQASPGFVAAVAEWVIAVMIDLGRGIGRYAAAARENRPLTPFVGRELRGSTLGVIGLGRIGSQLAELALAFGMRVLATTPQAIDDRGGRIRQVSLAELLGDSDFVVCLAPAQADTDKLMDAAAFGPCGAARSSSTRRAASSSTTVRCSPRSTRDTSAAPRSTSDAPPTRCRRTRSRATRASSRRRTSAA